MKIIFNRLKLGVPVSLLLTATLLAASPAASLSSLSRSGFSAAFAAVTFVASAQAEDTVSAPPVIAPAQPAGANQVSGTNLGGATAAGNTASSVGNNHVIDAPAAAPNQPGPMNIFIMIAIMLTVMYFFTVRPQQKKMKEHQALVTQLKSGDEVVTNAGIIGTITGMSEKVVTLEISKNVQMKILKSQVNQVIKGSVADISI